MIVRHLRGKDIQLFSYSVSSWGKALYRQSHKVDLIVALVSPCMLFS
jgi:hypothetical protein